MMTKRFRYVLSVGLVLLLIGCAGFVVRRSHASATTTDLTVSQKAAASLPHRSPNIPHPLLAAGLLPPTNKWYSSLAFSAQHQPVYAYPLTYAPTDTGFSISNPPVVSSPGAIFGSHVPDVSVNLGTSRHIVQAYDDLSVTIGQQDAGGATIATTRITQGSPFAFTELRQAGPFAVSVLGTVTARSAQTYLLNVGERHYGLYTTAPASVHGQTLDIDGKSGGTLTVFTVPDGADQQLYFDAAARPITSTSVTYKTTEMAITTTYAVSAGGKKTLFAATPSMHVDEQPAGGTFTTLLGKQPVYSGTNFSDKQDAPVMPSAELPLGKLTASERADLIQKLRSDTASLSFTQTDSYFGGKELYRAANLLQIAESLHQTDTAAIIKARLSARFDTWLDPSGALHRDTLSFYYDPSYHGVVGLKSSYGSDSFNDHHFHYGYFIYAAAVLSKYDSGFSKKHGDMINLLISDIASNTSSSLFPKLRVFDPYAGHSWASGTGDFADGNNQESSSEAINAWYGMYLWSQATHNAPLASESRWLYSLESHAATHQWLAASSPVANGTAYTHPTTGIVWGGKIDYSTFFSPRPQAILGIQLIPMSPGQAYLQNTAIAANISSAAPAAKDLQGQFDDYLVMYQALQNPALAVSNAAHIIGPDDLDNGNSMTYLYAWLYSH
jgi:endo-1,3(4)-beta-glucanase